MGVRAFRVEEWKLNNSHLMVSIASHVSRFWEFVSEIHFVIPTCVGMQAKLVLSFTTVTAFNATDQGVRPLARDTGCPLGLAEGCAERAQAEPNGHI